MHRRVVSRRFLLYSCVCCRIGGRYLIPRGADPAYDDGDDDSPDAEDPLIRLLRSDAAVQSIRACPLPAGGALIFSHRAMHWGSRGHGGCAAPRFSLSFGCAHASFEAPYLRKPRAHLPFPAPAVRQHGQSGRLGEATAGLHGLLSLHLKAWGCPPHS